MSPDGAAIQGLRIIKCGGRDTVFGPLWEGAAPKYKRGMYLKNGRLEWAGRLMMAKKGNREIARMTGMSRNTVIKLRKTLEAIAGAPMLCACGRAATHQGWCVPRLSGRSAPRKVRRRYQELFGNS